MSSIGVSLGRSLEGKICYPIGIILVDGLLQEKLARIFKNKLMTYIT